MCGRSFFISPRRQLVVSNPAWFLHWVKPRQRPKRSSDMVPRPSSPCPPAFPLLCLPCSLLSWDCCFHMCTAVLRSRSAQPVPIVKPVPNASTNPPNPPTSFPFACPSLPSYPHPLHACRHAPAPTCGGYVAGAGPAQLVTGSMGHSPHMVNSSPSTLRRHLLATLCH